MAAAFFDVPLLITARPLRKARFLFPRKPLRSPGILVGSALSVSKKKNAMIFKGTAGAVYVTCVFLLYVRNLKGVFFFVGAFVFLGPQASWA